MFVCVCHAAAASPTKDTNRDCEEAPLAIERRCAVAERMVSHHSVTFW